MSKTLNLRLLGNIEITLGDAPVTGFVSVKAQALLCYLAVTGVPHTRPALAGLFWGEKPEKAAFLNLRQALSNLRRLAGEYLIITRQTVAFDRDSPCWLDVEEFEELLRGDRAPLRDLRRAVDLYRGDFLDGLYVRDAPDFEAWVLLHRARYQTLATEALHRLIAHHSRRGEYHFAIRYARQLLAMNPWQEDVHRQLMWLLAHSGQREAALAQYERCRRILAADLGVEPMAETTALYERIRASRRILSPPLPPQPTPFVGRKGELRGILRRLANPDCRLLTLWGLGGVGKTRLALEAAARLQQTFLHGVYFVPLAAVTPPAAVHLPRAIAKALRLPAGGAGEPFQQVLDFLREKELLLVLDNFEHLTDGVPLLTTLLETAPEVKLLVTSRERLRSRWEWLFEVRGLPVPGESARRPERFAGVQLFLQEARRVRPGFAPGEEMDAVTRICRMVEGLPLGIELAAALLGEYDAEAVAAGIERTLGFLRSPLHDAPQRHHSLQAAFDHSWSLLSAEEKRVFRRLAVFRGGFEEEAAKVVAAPPALLRSLESKALLRRRPDGRYEMLEMLRQYANERLLEAEEERRQIRKQHGEYYASFLHRLWRQVRKGRGMAEMSQAVGREIENIQAAWQWAVAQEDWRALGAMLPPLSHFYEQRGWLREGEQAAAEAVAVLRRAVERGEDEAQAALGSSLARLGIMAYLLGRYEQARAALEESLSLVRRAGDRRELAVVLNNLAILSSLQGDYRQATEIFEDSLALFAAVGDRRMEAVLLNNIGLTYRIMGEHEEARRFITKSLDICREQGFKMAEGRAVLSLGIVAHMREEYDEAIRRYREALALFRELGDPREEAMALGNLGTVLIEKRDYSSARSILTESLALRREIGDRLGVVIVLNNLGRVTRELGELQAAQAYLARSLQLAAEIQSSPQALDALAEVARLWAAQEETVQALELACFVASHPAMDTITRRDAERLVARLEQRASPDVIASARKWGQGREVMEVVRTVLPLLRRP